MPGPMIGYFIEKIVLEKISPRSIFVNDIGRKTVLKFRILPIYNFAIIHP